MRRCTYSAILGVTHAGLIFLHREALREQHALGEEIAQAIVSAPIGEPIDEGELDDELAELEQEQLDQKMLQTGNVPVSDQIHKLPAAGNTESELGVVRLTKHANQSLVKGKNTRVEEDDEEEELRKLQAEMAM